MWEHPTNTNMPFPRDCSEVDQKPTGCLSLCQCDKLWLPANHKASSSAIVVDKSRPAQASESSSLSAQIRGEVNAWFSGTQPALEPQSAQCDRLMGARV